MRNRQAQDANLPSTVRDNGAWLRLADVARDLGFGVKRFGREDLVRLGIPHIDRGGRAAHGVRISRRAYEGWKQRGGVAA